LRKRRGVSRAAQEDEAEDKSGNTMHVGAPYVFAGAVLRTRKSGVGYIWMRQAEAPFRCSRRLTAIGDIAGKTITGWWTR